MEDVVVQQIQMTPMRSPITTDGCQLVNSFAGLKEIKEEEVQNTELVNDVNLGHNGKEVEEVGRGGVDLQLKDKVLANRKKKMRAGRSTSVGKTNSQKSN